MTTPEMTNSYEQNRLGFIAKQLEKTNTPREITIKYILSHDQERKAQEAKYNAELLYLEIMGDLIDENLALKEKLNAILSIINPDQTQE